MFKMKNTKRTLLMSMLSLLMCVSMFVGSTFAWFTDTVTSSSNKIQAGTLKVDLELLKDSGFVSIKESEDPLFESKLWEPGRVEAKILKIENEGTLALKWVAKFVSETELSSLANVIDVYVLASEDEISYPTSRALEGYTKVGTVAEFVNKMEETTCGTLLKGEDAYLGIALKMQEDAGNEYQGKDLAGTFDIQILATQYTFESDSFGIDYDANATFGEAEVSKFPKADVQESPEFVNTKIEWKSYGEWSPTPGLEANLEAAYTFSCVETPEQAALNPYADWYCDFYVMLNRDLGENQLFLGGNYGDFGWIGFHNKDFTLEANTEIGLLKSVTTNPWTYTDVVNAVGTFICGVGDVNDALSGATFTVMLRLTNPENPEDFRNIRTIEYTFK